MNYFLKYKLDLIQEYLYDDVSLTKFQHKNITWTWRKYFISLFLNCFVYCLYTF